MRATVWLFCVFVCVCACGAHASCECNKTTEGSNSNNSSPDELPPRGFEPLVDRALWKDNFLKNAHIFGVADLYKDIYKQVKAVVTAIPPLVRKKRIALSSDPMILLSRAWAYSFMHQILAGTDMPLAWREHAARVFEATEPKDEESSVAVAPLGRVSSANPASVEEFMDQFQAFAYYFLSMYSHDRLGVCAKLPAAHFDACISSLIPGLQTALYQSVIMFLEFSLLDHPRASMRENLYVAIVGGRCPLSSLFSASYLHMALNLGPSSHLHKVVRNSQELIPTKKSTLQRGYGFQRLMRWLMSKAGISVASMMRRLSKQIDMLYVPRDQLITEAQNEFQPKSREELVNDAKREHDELIENFTSGLGPLEVSIEQEQLKLKELYGDDSLATQVGLLKRVLGDSVMANAVPFLNNMSCCQGTPEEEKKGVLNKMRGLALGNAVPEKEPKA